jgi:hypothetical protein
MAFQMTPRMWEEMVAGAYERAGFDDVILTPRSGNLGRHVIAIKHGLGTIRVIDHSGQSMSRMRTIRTVIVRLERSY